MSVGLRAFPLTQSFPAHPALPPTLTRALDCRFPLVKDLQQQLQQPELRRQRVQAQVDTVNAKSTRWSAKLTKVKLWKHLQSSCRCR